jgi:hypothetical protein
MSQLIIYNSSLHNDTGLFNSFKNYCILKNADDYESIDKLIENVDVSSITHIALVYHSNNSPKIPFFPERYISEIKDNLPYYSDKYTNYSFYSDKLIELLEKFPQGITLDLLTCNLNQPDFIEETNQVETNLNINIRYSLNQSGNNTESDWVLESDNVNVKNLYFTEQIDLWNGNLLGSWLAVTSGTVGSVTRGWYSIASSSSGQYLIACIFGGNIWNSSDFGLTWTQRTGAGTRNWSAVSISADGSIQFAVVDPNVINASNNSLIFRSTDFGINFSQINSRSNVRYGSVANSSDGTICAVGSISSGYIWVSRNATDITPTWTSLGSTIRDYRSIAISSDGNTILAPALGGYIYLYKWSNTNYLQTEINVDNGPVKNWLSCTMSADATKMFAAILDGSFWYSIDSGLTWINSGTQNRYWRSLSCSSDGSIIFAANQGTALLKSTNNGVNWTLYPSPGLNIDCVSITTNSNGTRAAAAAYLNRIYILNESYSCTANTSSVSEGSSVTYTVTTQDVSSSITAYWTLDGSANNITSADIIGNLSSGSFNLTGGSSSSSGNFTITLANDLLTESPETLHVQIRTLSTTGPVVTSAPTVTVNNIIPTFSISTSSSTVNEGTDISFNITTTNVTNGTVLYWTLDGSANDISGADISGGATSGSVTINSNSGSIVIRLLADTLTEGPQTIQIRLRTDSTSGTVVASSPTVTVVDTSTTPIIIGPVGGGDPHIYPIFGEHYFLPHKEECFLLYDNQNEDRVIVTAKCWFLPENIKKNSKFKNHFMDDTTYFKYINIYYNGENITIDMETLKPVKYTNMNDVNNFKLNFINNETSFELSDYIEEKLIFKKHYNGIKLRKYKIEFNGKTRMIKLNNGYEFKLSVDLNCADHRNEIKIINANYSNANGALISEESMKVIDYLIPKIN